MFEFLTALYFTGLIMFGVAVGVYKETAPFAFMIIGAGTFTFALIMSMVHYLKVNKG